MKSRKEYYRKLGIAIPIVKMQNAQQEPKLKEITYAEAFSHVLNQLCQYEQRSHRVTCLLNDAQKQTEVKELFNKLAATKVSPRKPPSLAPFRAARSRAGSFAEHRTYSVYDEKLNQALNRKVAVLLPAVENNTLPEPIELSLEDLHKLNAVLQEMLKDYFTWRAQQENQKTVVFTP